MSITLANHETRITALESGGGGTWETVTYSVSDIYISSSKGASQWVISVTANRTTRICRLSMTTPSTTYKIHVGRTYSSTGTVNMFIIPSCVPTSSITFGNWTFFDTWVSGNTTGTVTIGSNGIVSIYAATLKNTPENRPYFLMNTTYTAEWNY